MDIQPTAEFCAFSDPMVKFPATRRVLFHHLVNVLLILFELSARLAKHLAHGGILAGSFAPVGAFNLQSALAQGSPCSSFDAALGHPGYRRLSTQRDGAIGLGFHGYD
jgi:hypothetical protein